MTTATSTQPLYTRTTQSKTFKREDQGYGWGRICSGPSCGTRLNHFNPNEVCAQCEARQAREATTKGEPCQH